MAFRCAFSFAKEECKIRECPSRQAGTIQDGKEH